MSHLKRALLFLLVLVSNISLSQEYNGSSGVGNNQGQPGVSGDPTEVIPGVWIRSMNLSFYKEKNHLFVWGVKEPVLRFHQTSCGVVNPVVYHDLKFTKLGLQAFEVNSSFENPRPLSWVIQKSKSICFEFQPVGEDAFLSNASMGFLYDDKNLNQKVKE